MNTGNDRVLFNFTIGGQLNCSVITYNGTGSGDAYDYVYEVATVVSDECIPLATATLYGAFNSTVGYTSEVVTASLVLQYDGKPLQSADILTPPSICTNATSLEESGIPDDELPFLHVVIKS